MGTNKLYILDCIDNVAVALDDIKKGEKNIFEVKDKLIEVQAKEDIPFCHKIAIKSISQGERIKKYGEDIGFAIKDIEEGCWLHTHNISCERGKKIKR